MVLEPRQRGGAAGHGPATCKGGGRLQLRPPYKGATDCDQAPCKGRPPVGAAARKGRPSRKGQQPAARLEGGDRQRLALPPAGATVPTARVAAPLQGDCRVQRAAAACAGQR
ncbi:hypothetical protein GW17_00031430 [Ensete ventricosum]|nr:hypothetical protein GW17_00031430 [Ensete ventricosum]